MSGSSGNDGAVAAAANMRSSSKFLSGTPEKDRMRDIMSGSMAGFTSKFVEFPLDTVKVLEQTNGHLYKGPFDCFVKTVREHGLFSLYKGMSSPLAGAILENAVVFSMYGGARDFLGVNEAKDTIKNNSPVWKFFAAGGFAGFGTALILTPVELVKCKLQVQQVTGAKATARIGPIKVVSDIIKADGFPGLFRGFFSTLLREVPGNAFWFGTYELSRRAWQHQLGYEKKSDLPLVFSALSGSVAGMAYWCVPFPADTAKSYLQTDPKFAGKSIAFVLRSVYNTAGLKGIYRGLPVTLTRAAPAHFVIFITYEYFNRGLANF